MDWSPSTAGNCTDEATALKGQVLVDNAGRIFRDFLFDDCAEDGYAWAIIGTHVTVWLYFVTTSSLLSITTAVEPLCWPYFFDCFRYRLTSQMQLTIVLVIYAGMLVSAATALWMRYPRGYTVLMLVTNIGLFALMSLDYRLRSNEFYMLFWVNGVFLLSKNRAWSVPAIIVSLYFWAGILKLNYEWLSGAALYADLWFIPRQFIPIACSYVIFLETVMIWGLLSSSRAIRCAVLVQLAAFHIESLSQIHWFYPLLMAAILSWFIVAERKNVRPTATLQGLLSLRAPVPTYALMAAFAALQLAPALREGDRALTGKGRVLALHMFEARQVCNVEALIVRAESPTEVRNLLMPELPPRMVCDFVVYDNRARNICRTPDYGDRVLSVDLRMKIKRTTDDDWRATLEQRRSCTASH